MPAFKSLVAIEPENQNDQHFRDRSTADGLGLLDWSKIDAFSASRDVAAAVVGSGDGAGKLAVLVNTPQMLRAANVFAEQAGLQGTQVRVFVDEGEALAWLYKVLPRTQS